MVKSAIKLQYLHTIASLQLGSPTPLHAGSLLCHLCQELRRESLLENGHRVHQVDEVAEQVACG